MTTFNDARGELEAALASVGNGATSSIGGVVPPFVFIACDGADFDTIVMGKCPVSWRIILAAGGWELDTTADVLDTMRQAAIPLLRALSGWQLVSLGRDAQRLFGDQQLLGAELRAVRMIDL